MRRLLAGKSLLLLLALWLVATPSARADTKGEVESVGFGSLYRPNCYIPMLVRVQADKSGTYQIHVIQDDLDADQPHFVQTVSLTGNDGGAAAGSEQRFWLYFIPQPTDGGLPDVVDGLRAIQQTLKVFLCDENGKQLVQLPVTTTIQNLDKLQAGPSGNSRGVKLVLAVAEGGQQPVWRDYQNAIGTIEDVVFVTLRASDLPEDVRGFDMVDAIVWLNAPAPDPAKASDEKRYRALREYVSGGGHLVVCQPAQRDATVHFQDLMPVDVKAIAPRQDLQPLRRLATEKRPKAGVRDEYGDPKGPLLDDWDLPKPPFNFARGELKKGAVADEWVNWKGDPKDTSDMSPYLARIGYGAGCVTWVAHDLSDPSLTARTKSGWPWVWDRVLDFKHDLTIITTTTPDETKRPYAPGSIMDVGVALNKGMELSSKSRLLVTIAVVFFIAYWVVAGPGVYLYLVTKSRPQLSWFMFAFSALVATVLTVLVVRLVVRGAPELAHVTLVRSSPDAPPLSISRMGLYIPRDGNQEIFLPEVEPKQVSYIAAFPAHPSHLSGEIEFPAHMQYVVPTRDATEEVPVKLTVPYRSTMKQFEVRRVGKVGGIIEGKPVLRETEGGFRLEGSLFNASDHALKNIYLVFNQPLPSDQRYDGEVGEDYVFYLPKWEKAQSLDLGTAFDNKTKFIGLPRDASGTSGYPDQGNPLRGPLGKPGQAGRGWVDYWYASGLRNTGFGNTQLQDLDAAVSKSFPMMSLFGRLPAMMNSTRSQQDRVELLRRGGRNLDVSGAVAAGRMVVLAEAVDDAPLPFPLEVEGDKVEGKGTLYYQAILTLDRIELPPTTQPGATQPASTQAAQATVESPPVPAAAKFDPATFAGDPASLTPEERRQVLDYRRLEALRRAAQKRGQRP